jgi:hypothetical protein
MRARPEQNPAHAVLAPAYKLSDFSLVHLIVRDALTWDLPQGERRLCRHCGREAPVEPMGELPVAGSLVIFAGIMIRQPMVPASEEQSS